MSDDDRRHSSLEGFGGRLRIGPARSILLDTLHHPDVNGRRTLMALVEAKGLVHFSLPANDVEESLKFYTDVLGMKFRGNVGPNGRCVTVGDVNIILVERPKARPFEELEEVNTRLCHQAFQVSSEDYDRALESFKEHGVKVAEEEYRKTGTFTGRSFYFFDPTGNRLEINDPNPPYWPEDAK